jgi:hypothetical protein
MFIRPNIIHHPCSHYRMPVRRIQPVPRIQAQDRPSPARIAQVARASTVARTPTAVCANARLHILEVFA